MCLQGFLRGGGGARRGTSNLLIKGLQENWWHSSKLTLLLTVKSSFMMVSALIHLNVLTRLDITGQFSREGVGVYINSSSLITGESLFTASVSWLGDRRRMTVTISADHIWFCLGIRCGLRYAEILQWRDQGDAKMENTLPQSNQYQGTFTNHAPFSIPKYIQWQFQWRWQS